MPLPHSDATSEPAIAVPVPGANLLLSSTPPPPPIPSSYTGASYFSSPSPRSRLPTHHPFARPGSRQQQQRQYDHDYSHGSVDGSSLAAHPAYPSQHITFTAAGKNRSPRTDHTSKPSLTLLPPDTRLRTSSLLPPVDISFDTTSGPLSAGVGDRFNEPGSPHIGPDTATEPEPQHKRGHSHSSSAGALSDSLRNLNRWSASTTSSRASNIAGFTRRISGEVFGSPSRKLHKIRPSTSSDSPQQPAPGRTRYDSPPTVLVPPLQSLPRISTGPSLEEEVRQANLLARQSSILRPKYVRRPSQDPGLYWDGTPQIPEQQSGPPVQIEPAETLLPAPIFSPASTMPYHQNGDSRGHSRNRSNGAKASADSTSSRNRDRDRERAGRPPSQKAMLSKALQKANTAVQLDNAQNIEGASRAYTEACGLLQQVLDRTTADDDRRKLEAIYETYMGRINELEELLPEQELDDKELPHRPESNDAQSLLGGQINIAVDPSIETNRHQPRDYEDNPLVYSQAAPSTTRSPPSLTIQTSDPREGGRSYLTEQYSLQSAFSKARHNNGSTLQPPMEDPYLPPPLSPRRPISPSIPPPPPPVPAPTSADQPGNPEQEFRNDYPTGLLPSHPPNGHRRGNSHESISWLAPIDESGGSSASSVHSRSPSIGVRRKHIRGASGDTEAEFDAALDDAIEAAYDDGYEPDTQYNGAVYNEDSEVAVTKALQKVELARERVRESEREALVLANERERRLRLQQQLEDEEYSKEEEFPEDFYFRNDSEDEERMLEEMTKGYRIEDFAFGHQARPPVPRESDSSGITSRTWHSSMGSNPPTATTILTTVSEHAVLPHPTAPLPPPPTQALPQLPDQAHSAELQDSTVRARRLSGQNPKQLKIETTKLTQPEAQPAVSAGPAPHPKMGGFIAQQRQALSAGPGRTNGPPSARPVVSPAPAMWIEESSTPPPLPNGFVHDEQPRSGSPSVTRPGLKKNFSSSSLKSIKSRNLSVSHIEDGPEVSPGTPLSNPFGMGGSTTRIPSLPSITTPMVATFRERSDTAHGGTAGFHLFDNGIHSPEEHEAANAQLPVPLEPCPTDVMLRPFWLMRCLYQTLCHPLGGYLSNKLFVPRDVWRVKGVKLKNVEDKIFNCDLLTAALQKLAMVDTCDADLMLDEMQALETVLDQVQASLTRKLGHEVGMQGASAMFRDAGAGEHEGASLPRSASVAGKASSFSWRRLRSKNSSANLVGMGTSYGGKGSSGGTSNASSAHVADGAAKDMILPSLPMTSHPTSRPTKREVRSVSFGGPNANYMSSLAKLFDAAQCIDQIARQVDDPGLRHANQTQVGLELCTRHAAEFFGFYICRFVLSDLTMMLDKFVKRGSEWVLV